MNSIEFVNAVKSILRDQVIRGQFSHVSSPPGRRVSEFQTGRAEWMQSLSPEQKDYVRSAIADGFDAAIFSLFVVFDGGSPLEDPPECRGRFELLHVDRQGVRTLLNTHDIALHELYK